MPFTKSFQKIVSSLLTVCLAFFAFIPVESKDLEITGQKDLSVEQGKSITLQLSDFTVKGPGEDRYPTGFRLQVFDGDNYRVSGTTVTPDLGFMGTLKVNIKILRIKDGKVRAESDRTNIKVEVTAQTNTPPRIIAQKAIRILMNQSVKINFDHLTVVDPDNNYPTGFSLKLSSGSNFTITQATTVAPDNGYIGTLFVNIIVNDGKADSQPFALQIEVVKENTTEPPSATQGPVFVNFSDRPLSYSLGNSEFYIAREVEIDDPDSKELYYAEVFFDEENFISGKDQLMVETSGKITSVFDADAGILVIFGRESISLYQQALQSIKYNFASDSLSSQTERRVHFRLNDGAHSSDTKSKSIILNETIELDIPTAFTPNNDNANDLWVVRPIRMVDNVEATVRIFDKRGVLLFESNDLMHFWDGKSNDQPVPPDTYFYTIDVAVGVNRVRHHGIVAVLR